jgi:hypothetical protein
MKKIVPVHTVKADMESGQIPPLILDLDMMGVVNFMPSSPLPTKQQTG